MRASASVWTLAICTFMRAGERSQVGPPSLAARTRSPVVHGFKRTGGALLEQPPGDARRQEDAAVAVANLLSRVRQGLDVSAS